MEREAFVCPFCGAPQKGELPSSATQVKCSYCGGMIVVPRRLTGLTQRCPNHSDALTTGFCTRCGQAFCGRCLYVFQRLGGAKEYLCPRCAGLATIEATPGIYFLICFSVLFLVVGLSGVRGGGDSAALTLMSLFLGMYCLAGGIIQRRRITNMPTVASKAKEHRGSLDT
ncbi:MAG: hypothetical protein C4K47_04385 [Candidatus Thorarchaeota archaeon]|nr:MAG: hypothetical protein C4K47_04385 [Candidatus Thorarchaeota archaeon]